MTLAELREALKAMPTDAKVVAKGCYTGLTVGEWMAELPREGSIEDGMRCFGLNGELSVVLASSRCVVRQG